MSAAREDDRENERLPRDDDAAPVEGRRDVNHALERERSEARQALEREQAERETTEGKLCDALHRVLPTEEERREQHISQEAAAVARVSAREDAREETARLHETTDARLHGERLRADEKAELLERQRAALAALREAHAATEAAVRSRDEILAIVAHDLRNPLNNVLLNTSALLRDARPGNGRLVKRGEAIRRSALRMDEMISDLVDAAGIETGRLSVDLCIVDAPSIVAEVVETMAPLAVEKGLTLEKSVTASRPIRADRGRVHQVLSNLIGNAIKFTPAGGTVRVSAEDASGAVLFKVSDTGAGIPAREVEKVFRRYWRSDRSEGGGLGLGLFIARSLVAAHGGTIWVESAVGRGSTFSFTIPCA